MRSQGRSHGIGVLSSIGSAVSRSPALTRDCAGARHLNDQRQDRAEYRNSHFAAEPVKNLADLMSSLIQGQA
jgi:hypothetical protein